MRRLLPEPPAEVDAFDAYGDVPGPWLRVGMVASADGSVTDEESWTLRLGGVADFRVFRALRALSDAILVGAGTIRTGRVGPHRMKSDLRARRAVSGKPAPAPIVVFSRSLDLDWGLQLFSDAESPTLVVTSAAALRGAEVPDEVRPHVLVAGDVDVNLAGALRQLRTRFGLEHLLCEGGPALTTALIGAGLVDELCLNIAPTLIGNRHHTRMVEALAERAEMALTDVYHDDGVLFLRYRLKPEALP
jgi:riboflavin biosynthesis pyrimidine reductase